MYEATHFDLRGFCLRASSHLAQLGRALTAMYGALLAYVPRTYEGRVILLRAKAPTLFRTTDPKMGWQFGAAKGFEVNPITGRHGGCMAQQYEPELARLLLQFGESFDGNGDSYEAAWRDHS